MGVGEAHDERSVERAERPGAQADIVHTPIGLAASFATVGRYGGPVTRPSTDQPSAEPKPGPVVSPADAAFAQVSRLDGQLDGIDELPLAEAALRFGSIHTELQAALTDLDSA